MRYDGGFSKKENLDTEEIEDYLHRDGSSHPSHSSVKEKIEGGDVRLYDNTIVLASVAILLLSGCLSKPKNIEMEIDPNTHGPVMINIVKPVYPEEAKVKGVEGVVWVKMWVDTLGRVKTVLINESPDPVLNEPAFQAAVQTKFKPAMRDGKRIGVWLIAPFEVRKE